MIPAITFLGKTIYPYPVLALIGLFAAGLFAIYAGRRRGVVDDDMIVFLLFAAAGALIGGHMLYGIVNFKKTLPLIAEINSFKSFLAWCTATFGGSVFYGGLIGGIIVGRLCLKKMKRGLQPYADIMGAGTPLFHVFGRIGCFLGGCCYGVESDIGFVYRHALTEGANGVTRFPIQLVEAGCNLILFLVFARLLKKEKLQGRIFALYLMVYPVIRFILEFWRGDTHRGFLFGLSTSQCISIPLFVIGVIWFLRGRKAERTLR